jgi:signal transduction histidine kinase/CheY-like chemotaxis protein
MQAEVTQTVPRFLHAHEVVSKLLASILVLLGIGVLAGWVFQIEILKTFLPGYISMKGNTASGFLSAGVCLLIANSNMGGRRPMRYLAMACATLVFLIGALTLGEYLFKIDFRIDELLFRDAVQFPYPGRLAPITALNFCIGGLALVTCLFSRRLAVVSQLLALASGLSALLAIVGYAYGVPLLYGSFRYTSMAFHTGVGFLVLTLAVLCLQCDQGLMSVVTREDRAGWLARRLIPAAVIVPCLLGALFLDLSPMLGDIRLTIAAIVLSQSFIFVVLIWTLTFANQHSELKLRIAENAREEIQMALSKSENLLRQSQKMEAVGRLSAGIAHDFNNILAVVVGFSELLLLRGPQLAPDQRNKIERIKQAGESAAGLTRQLLAFSRQQLIKPSVLDFNDLVSRLEEILRRLIREDVEVSVSLDPNCANVFADQGQMEQVLMNLAVNGSDAMPSGGKLRIATESVHVGEPLAAMFAVEPGKYVRLSVSDTGSGMSPEIKAHIFEPFYTTKSVGKGTGLGLATVYGIVQQSGGFLEVETAVGQGSVFRVYFPETDRSRTDNAAPTKPHRVIGQQTVMVVEDQAALRDLLGETLKIHGYNVLIAEDGAEALAISRNSNCSIDVLLTDIIMPGMNGRELAERIRDSHPQTLTIFMSGYTSDIIEQQDVAGDSFGFIEKPFSSIDLARKISEALERREEQRSRQSSRATSPNDAHA